MCNIYESKIEEQTSIKDIVHLSLELCSFLNKKVPITDYLTNHSYLVLYLQVFYEKISNLSEIKSDLDSGYNLALRCNLLMPRLYISYMLALSLHDSEKIDMILSMIPALSNPIKGIALRFTILSFFPLYSKTFIDQSLDFYLDMLSMTRVLEQFGDFSVSSYCDMVCSSASIVLSRKANYSDICLLINYIFMNVSQELSIGLIRTILLSIENSFIVENHNLFHDFIKTLSLSEKSLDLIRFITSRINSIRIRFEILRNTVFEQHFLHELFSSALKEGNSSLLSDILSEKPKHDILCSALAELGVERFIFLSPEYPKGNPIIEEIIKLITPSINPVLVRKILINELRDRSLVLENLITKVIQYHHFPKEFFLIVFAEPFVFQASSMLNFIVTKGKFFEMSNEILINFIDRSEKILPYKLTPLYSMVMEGDDLVNKVLGLNDSLSRRLLVSGLVTKNVSSQSIINISSQCKAPSDLLSLTCLAIHHNLFDVSRILFDQILSYDTTYDTLIDRFNLYFSVINTMFSSKLSFLEYSSNYIKSFFVKLKEIDDYLKHICFPLFPLSVVKKWKSIIKDSMRKIDLYSDELLWVQLFLTKCSSK